MKKLSIFIFIFIILVNYNTKSQSEWDYTSLSINPTSIKFFDIYSGWVVGYDNNNVKIFKTTNRGDSWTDIKSVSRINAYPNSSKPAIALLDANKGFLYYGKYLYKTLNGGANWYAPTEFYDFNNLQGMQTIKFKDSNTGFLTYTDPNHPNKITKVKRTNDGGNIWTETYNRDFYWDAYLYLTDIVFIDNFAYFVGFEKHNTLNWSRHFCMKYNIVTNERVFFYPTNTSNKDSRFKYACVTPDGQIKILGVYIDNLGNTGTYCYADYSENSTKYKISDNFEYLQLGGISFSDNNNGTAIVGKDIYITSNGGVNWQLNYSLPSYVFQEDENLKTIGNEIYVGSNSDKRMYYRNINLSLFTLFDNNPVNWKININGTDYNTPENYYFRSGVINVNTSNENLLDKIFYSWSDGSFLQNRTNYNLFSNSSLGNKYKTKQKSTEETAISNINQTKAIRDDLGQIHQVHSSIGGIFSTRSPGSGYPFESETVVNGGQLYSQQFPNDNSAENNKNPSVNIIKYFNPENSAPAAYKIAVVWERYNQQTSQVDLLCALQSSGLNNPWTRFGNNLNALDGKITSLNSSVNYNSKPDIYSLYISGEKSDVRNFMMIVPHLEPSSNGSKLVVSAKYQNYTGTDYYNPGSTTNDFEIVSDFVSDYSSVYEPYEDVNNNSKGAYIYLTYKKNGNIYYRRELVFFSSNFNGIFRDEIPVAE